MKFSGAAAAAVLIAFAGAAQADDMIVSEPTVSSSSFDWTGFYAGINAGYGASDATSVVGPLNPAGSIAGIQAGYNQQFGKFVLGVEGDVQWSGVKGTHVGPAITSSASLDYFGTARVRAGVAIDRLMPYITAGVSAGQVSGTSTFGGGFTTTQHGAGIAAGIGAEYAATDRLTLKAEYLYVDYGDITFFPGTVIEEKIRSRMSAVRVGLNYKF